MLRRLLVVISCVCVLASPLLAVAIGLGNIQLYSYLGQNFHAEVPVINVGKIPASSLTVSLSPSAQFKKMAIANIALAHELKTQVVLSADNQPIVQIKSEQPLSLPFIEFNLNLHWPGGNSKRVYSLFINPESYQAGQSLATAPNRQPLANFQTSPAADEQQPSVVEDVYGPVQAHENLWSISQQVKPEQASQQQTMIAIYRKNLSKFIQQNYTEIRAGAYLTIPKTQTILAVDPTWTLATHAKQIQQQAKQAAMPSLLPATSNDTSGDQLTTTTEQETNASIIIKQLRQQLAAEKKRNAFLQAQLNKVRQDVANISKSTAQTKQDLAVVAPGTNESTLMTMMRSMAGTQPTLPTNKNDTSASEPVVFKQETDEKNIKAVDSQQIKDIAALSMPNIHQQTLGGDQQSQPVANTSTASATAVVTGSNRNTYLLLALVGLIVLFLWNKRRQNALLNADEQDDDGDKPSILERLRQLIPRKKVSSVKATKSTTSDEPLQQSEPTAAQAQFEQQADDIKRRMQQLDDKREQVEQVEQSVPAEPELEQEDKSEETEPLPEGKTTIEPKPSTASDIENQSNFVMDAGQLADSFKSAPSAPANQAKSTVIDLEPNEQSASQNINIEEHAKQVFIIANKLELAQTYIEMGEIEEADGLLQEVLSHGNKQQQQQAQKLRQSYQQMPPDES